METKEIDKYVAKANSLVTMSKFDMTEQEQKLLLLIIAQVKPDDIDFHPFECTVSQLIDILGCKVSGRAYSMMRSTIQNLANRSAWIEIEAGHEKLFRWVDTADIDNGKVIIKIHNDMLPFLTELRERFTMYQLRNIMALDGKYTVRIYELLKCYSFLQCYEMEIEELKDRIYPPDKKERPKYAWGELQRRIINPAIKQINEITDLFVSYEPVRSGHKYTRIKFTISKKDTIQNFHATMKQEKKIYGTGGKENG